MRSNALSHTWTSTRARHWHYRSHVNINLDMNKSTVRSHDLQLRHTITQARAILTKITHTYDLEMHYKEVALTRRSDWHPFYMCNKYTTTAFRLRIHKDVAHFSFSKRVKSGLLFNSRWTYVLHLCVQLVECNFSELWTACLPHFCKRPLSSDDISYSLALSRTPARQIITRMSCCKRHRARTLTSS